MARIEGLALDDAAPELRTLLEQLPPLPHFRLLAHAQSAFGPRLTYGQVLMGQLELADPLHELIILRIAARTGCEYVAVQHRHAAAKAGVPASTIHAAESLDVNAVGFTALEFAVILLVDQMMTNYRASEEVVLRVRDHLGERQLIEIGLVVERYLGLSIILNSLGALPSEPQDLEPVRDARR